MTLTIAKIMARLPQAFVADRAPGVDAVVHFKFTGDEPGEWNAVIRDGSCQVAQGLPRLRPTITLAADSGDFRNVAAGDLDPARAFMEGRIQVSGNLELARTLVSMFRTA